MIGETISHYNILSKLGSGGMGVVYLAEDTKLRRKVALKFLPQEFTREKKARERFIQEARAASSLDHPNICTIHSIEETGEPKEKTGARTFIVMACYEGKPLESIAVAYANCRDCNKAFLVAREIERGDKQTEVFEMITNILVER